MTIKINELIIRGRIEKNDNFSQGLPNVPTENDEYLALKKPMEIVSINKINRER